jgi:CheY-like chemotaxis protein
MIHAETHQTPISLPLALAPAQNGDGPREHGDRPELRGRSLRVLIVEDELFIALHTQSLLQMLGHSVVGIAVSADDAVRFAEREQPDLALMDIRLLGPRDGIEAADEIYSRFAIASIFITANTDARTRAKAAFVTSLGFLEKPLTKERLEGGLARLTRR